MSFVIPAPPQASLAIANTSDRFPVRRIFCVGRNYAEHAREMGNDPDKEPPFFFTKPADAVRDAPCDIPYPPKTADLHYEVELVVVIGVGGTDIAPEDVAGHLWGAGVGIDLTRRDLQAEAKRMGRPWDMAKGFDASAPCAALLPMDQVPSLTSGEISLSLNEEPRQSADLADMIWPVAEHVAYLSGYVALAPGDLIMTGTPAGVGATRPGDVLHGRVAGLPELEIRIVG